MKYTFKNRPKLRKVYGAPSIHPNEDLTMLIEDYNRLEEWLEGLGKELRQSLDQVNKIIGEIGIFSSQKRAYWLGYKQVLKEVLGEDSE